MSKEKTQDNDFRKLVRYFWILAMLPPLGLGLLLFLTWAEVFYPLPSTEDIANPKSFLASQIVSSDGELLGTFFRENRTHAEFKDLHPDLPRILVATEDERFYEHSGIDFRSLARAVGKLGKDGGGSTLSQQLAKQLFTENFENVSIVTRISQKLGEWIIATRLEKRYTKEEIIVLYLNQVDFIYDAVGINSAAQTYFGVTPDSLQMHESAMLVGMVKNPVLYNPKRFPENALKRRNVVFGQMLRNGMITEAERDSLVELPLGLSYNRSSHNKGLAPYFREYLRSYMSGWIENHTKPDGTKYNLYTDGIKIYTTIDSRMQRYAEEAVTEHMSNLQRVFYLQEKNRRTAPFHNLTSDEVDRLLNQAKRRSQHYKALKKRGMSADSIDIVFNTPKPMTVFSWTGDIDTVMSPMDSIRYYKHFYQAGMMSVEPQTGFVKAWVGGNDYRYFKYDHVKQGKRQVGSTFKPFVYATAIKQKHFSPCMEVPNVLTCIEEGTWGLQEDWCPKNSDDKYGGKVSLKFGLANSMNTITTYLMKQTGPIAVSRLAEAMGVRSEIPEVPSIALGTVDLSVYEMVGTYTTFANKGIYTEPIMITRIEDKNGVVLEEFSPRTREVMSEEDAYVVVDLLRGVTEGGTGVRLRTQYASYYNDVVTGYPYGFENEICGKTGTTQNNSDGWFMGMVPNLITGVWTGCEDRSAHFGNTYYGQGATTALPIWALYMRKCYEDPKTQVSKQPFERPENPISIELDCNKYNSTQSGIEDEDPEF
ncbi:MAG: transglycosylase domain-containing protein [Schleiferiaceae bacterium]